MRDPKRIDKMVELVRAAWKMFPDMRLGQLMENVVGEYDMFNTEDTVMSELLKGFMEAHKPDKRTK